MRGWVVNVSIYLWSWRFATERAVVSHKVAKLHKVFALMSKYTCKGTTAQYEAYVRAQKNARYVTEPILRLIRHDNRVEFGAAKVAP